MELTLPVIILMGGVNYLVNPSDSFIGKEITLALDNDNDSKPDILDFDGVQQLHALNSAESLDASIPFMLWYDTLPTTESADSINVELTAGTDYTFEFSKNFTEALGARLPHLEVFDPEGVMLSPDKFALSVYPAEHPSIVCYTFKPETSGAYSITVTNAYPSLSDDVDTSSVMFVYREMHNEAGENGYPVRFKITDDADTVSARNIVYLRKTILKANPNYISYLSGKTTAGDTFEISNETEDFDTWMGILKRSEGIYSDDEGANTTASFRASANDNIVPPDFLYDIPYESRYAEGSGFLATTNLREFASALTTASSKVPTPTSKQGSTHYTYQFISSMEEYERSISANFAMSLSYSAVGASASASYSNNYKFGLNSTTLLIHYDELESDYRYVDIDKCQFTSDALAKLNSGSEEFRRNYGDYFVAGYQFGGTFNAFITITTETSEQLYSVEAAIEANLKSSATFNANVGAKVKESLERNNAQISVEIRTIGAGNNVPEIKNVADSGNYSSIAAVAEAFTAFRNSLAESFSPSTYAPVKVVLRRYYTLNGVRDKLSQAIPITLDHRKKIEQLNRELISMRGYYNVVKAIPTGHIQSSVADSYASRFNDIIDTVTLTGNPFYENYNQVNTTLGRAKTLSQELKDLGGSYVFYRKLVYAQAIEKRGWLPNGNSYSGCVDFPISEAVTSDINAGIWSTEKRTVKIGDGYRTWHPIYDAGSNGAFCYIRVWCHTSEHWYDDDEKRQCTWPPAVGRQQARFIFTRHTNGQGSWEIERRTMRFNSTLYPFRGLKRWEN